MSKYLKMSSGNVLSELFWELPMGTKDAGSVKKPINLNMGRQQVKFKERLIRRHTDYR